MIDWLTATHSVEPNLAPSTWLLRLLAAALYGSCVMGIYLLSHGRTKRDAHMLAATLVLLSILIAMVSLVIGESIARAFSLVGALSIVRFRTVVEDTRDTAFVIFAVIVGMAAGAGLLLLPLLGIPLVGAVAIALNRRSRPGNVVPQAESTLAIRLSLGREPEHVLAAAFERYVASHRLTSVATARQGAALELHYGIMLRSHGVAPGLVGELNQIEGVQSVELQLS